MKVEGRAVLFVVPPNYFGSEFCAFQEILLILGLIRVNDFCIFAHELFLSLRLYTVSLLKTVSFHSCISVAVRLLRSGS